MSLTEPFNIDDFLHAISGSIQVRTDVPVNYGGIGDTLRYLEKTAHGAYKGIRRWRYYQIPKAGKFLMQ